jgi:oligopeptidase B
LDLNELAPANNEIWLGTYRISPDHQLLAYSVNFDGSEKYTIYVKDLSSGDLLPDAVPNTYYSVEWANDNQTLFYNVLDHAHRPYRLYRHRLGTEAQADELVYEETNESYYLSLSKTRSEAYLVLSLYSGTTTEKRVLPADQPNAEFRIVEPRRHKIEYSLDHHGDHFYIVTNDDAINFKVVKAPVADPGRANWQDYLPHRPEIKVDGVDCFANYLVVYERENGLEQGRVINLDTEAQHRIEFPEPTYSFWPTGNDEFETEILRLGYTSLVTPNSTYDYQMDNRSWELLKQEPVLGGYDPEQYQSERVFATAPDGVQVPMSLVYKKGLVRDGSNPCYLIGYGSYGATYDPFFASSRLSLLDRGFVCGLAHIRGGGEMGRPWSDAGKVLTKKNTFTDFIACAEYLIDEKYTSPSKLVVRGASAGGLLMGAVATMRPDLFQAVVAEVPFVDVINTILDPTIPLTVIEYEEWGNPAIEEEFRYMLAYSPYDHVEAKDYPNLLVTGGLNDPRVQYWEPAKWTAKLRVTKTDQNRLLLKTKLGAGHSGPSGRYASLRELAFTYAFVLDMVGINQ